MCWRSRFPASGRCATGWWTNARSLERVPMRLNHLRSLTVSVTSPRRGEVRSRLRDPGEGDPSPECIHSPLTRNARARRAHSDLSPPELGFTRVRHLRVAEVGYIRLRLGRGEERLRQSRRNAL